jgi:hypothetical protein
VRDGYKEAEIPLVIPNQWLGKAFVTFRESRVAGVQFFPPQRKSSGMAPDGYATRPWQNIAKELIAETNPKATIALSEELNLALELQVKWRHSAPADADTPAHKKANG